ncbi:urea permease [Sporothrix stenoceras]|uniref:Urea permease n=1 Tax=Sporothrix stenoceras TaxID=5173 RepID=A0ABR3YLF3_9PEZI
MSSTGSLQVLEPGVGYGLVAGLGAGFCLLMILITLVQNRYGRYNSFQSSEEFNAASRSVKPGMIAAGIVSSWTHATTLLTSCTLAYSYGVGGGLWYGAIGSSMTLLFACTAYRVKKSANNAHTFPEIVLARHGKLAHKIYTFFGLISNVINGSALLTGGCGVFASLSGMNIWASYFILILAVQSYIVVGGLRSTFISDYLHTTFLFGCIFTFMFSVYAVSPAIGSPEALYDLLKQHTADSYNKSYFTVKSRDGLVTAMTILLGSISAIWTDQAYWQRIIASDPRTAVRGYVLGSAAWYAIPFAMSTCMGLAAAALQGTEYAPIKLTSAQVSAGLAAPAAAIALLGKSGAQLMIVLLFMAVTSSTSAESIAASSLMTFDIYKAYINPKAQNKTLLWTSIVGLFIYGIVLAAVCCIFNKVGISLSFLVKIFGCLMGGGSFPMAAIVLWDKTSTAAARWSPIAGLCSGLITWMVTTKVRSGHINVTTLGDAYNSLAADAVSIGIGLVMVISLTLIFPAKMPFVINGVPTDMDAARAAEVAADIEDAERDEKVDMEKTLGQTVQPITDYTDGNAISSRFNRHREPIVPISALTPEQVRSQKMLAWMAFTIGFFGFFILLPLTLYGTGYTFSLGFFKAYVVVAFLWIWISAVICIFLPLWESRMVLWNVLKAMYGDVTGKK